MADTTSQLYYFIGETTKNTNIINSARVEETLTSKADISLSNINNVGAAMCAHMAMPSETYDELTLDASGTSYTAPTDGYIYINKLSANAGEKVEVEIVDSNGNHIYKDNKVAAIASQDLTLFIPIQSGSTYKVTFTATGTTQYFRFCRALGAVENPATLLDEITALIDEINGESVT